MVSLFSTNIRISHEAENSCDILTSDLKMTFSSSTGRLFISQLSSEGGCEGSLVQFSSSRSPIWATLLKDLKSEKFILYLIFFDIHISCNCGSLMGKLWKILYSDSGHPAKKCKEKSFYTYDSHLLVFLRDCEAWAGDLTPIDAAWAEIHFFKNNFWGLTSGNLKAICILCKIQVCLMQCETHINFYSWNIKNLLLLSCVPRLVSDKIIQYIFRVFHSDRSKVVAPRDN